MGDHSRAPALCGSDVHQGRAARRLSLLKPGGTIWYAPDQDMRGKDAVFVPFFGMPASTITATHHFARLSGAAVIPFFHQRLPDGGYALRLEAPLEDFPSADAVSRHRTRQRRHRTHGARGTEAVPLDAQAFQVTPAWGAERVLKGRMILSDCPQNETASRSAHGTPDRETGEHVWDS